MDTARLRLCAESEMARPAGWYEDLDSLVANAMATPDRPAAPGW